VILWHDHLDGGVVVGATSSVTGFSLPGGSNFSFRANLKKWPKTVM